MLRQCNGFVLLPVLICMQIIYLLGLSQLLTGLQLFHTMKLLQTQSQFKDVAIMIMEDIQRMLKSQKLKCILPVTLPIHLLSKDNLWWESQGCSGNFKRIRYHYIVEELGNDPCFIFTITNENDVASYYRISILLSFDKKRLRSIWQASYAIPSKRTQVCTGHLREVHMGQLMLRELTR